MGHGHGINPETLTRIRAMQAEQLAKVEQARREGKYRRNRPVWTKLNRVGAGIALGVLGLIVAWVLYLAFF
jgi:hypothetical protein